ncbi:MAG: right-handed parallel beta-helix repeat-containing protein [Bacilli bacterium]|nr:right-handed parallel beta-helix repeat-containing protein [Bacilli bacterium]
MKVKKVLVLFILFLLVFGTFACKPEEAMSENGYEDLFVGDFSTPGLHEKDGGLYSLLEANKVTGKTINVLDFGAKNDSDFDNTDSFKNAINSAEFGDEIYVPKGEYHFGSYATTSGGYYSHILLKKGINLRGEDEKSTILISNFLPTHNETKSTSVITTLSGCVVISNLTITSLTANNQLPDPDNSSVNTSVYSAPKYGITVANSEPIEIVENVYIKNVTVEKFRRMGVRVVSSRNVVIEECSFKNAVDLGGGGHGYGVVFQGRGNDFNDTGLTIDCLFNVVRNSKFIGPYLRHGVIVQYYSHNNLIESNSFQNILLDAIDLHGEDEYSNEITKNEIINTRAGAAIGVGNSGSTHDASGPNNFIHDNDIIGGARGIDVILGSEKTIIFNNRIRGLTLPNSTGILLSNANHSRVIKNTIENIKGEDSIAIKINYSFYPLNPSQGIPDGYVIKGNIFKEIKNGVYIETKTDNFIYEDNVFTGVSGYKKRDESSSFILPSISDEVIEKIGNYLAPTDNNFITTEAKNSIQTQKNMKFKASVLEPEYNRMIYAKFNIEGEMSANIKNIYLTFAAKSKDGKATINIYGSTNYLDWNENDITWNNSKLHEESLAKAKLVDGEYSAVHIHDFTFPTVGQEFKTYYINITDFIKNLQGNEFTLIFSNDLVQEMYMEVYSSKHTVAGQMFGLIFSTE